MTSYLVCFFCIAVCTGVYITQERSALYVSNKPTQQTSTALLQSVYSRNRNVTHRGMHLRVGPGMMPYKY